MNNQKVERPNVENETSKANRINVRSKTIDGAAAVASAGFQDDKGKPWADRDFRQRLKDMTAQERFMGHAQTNGGGSYKKGDIYDE